MVGIGSVGTRCLIVLLTGRDTRDPLLLQLKEAGRSVLEDHRPPLRLDAEVAVHRGGRRVVTGQRLMQAAGDLFLGRTAGPAGRHFHGRRLRDPKGSVDVDSLTPAGLRGYAKLCGRARARTHARTGDRLAVAGYLGSAGTFAEAVADVAATYADRTAADHADLLAAIGTGRITAARRV
ncbi:DUF2252 family protein [Kitasatospora sp. NPDC001539]|uniref:DUF2252 family protein n=1 Tax=Kitasatospora sp. NPDC001539 TaxID=3154384 RepID=UPI003328CE97